MHTTQFVSILIKPVKKNNFFVLFGQYLFSSHRQPSRERSNYKPNKKQMQNEIFYKKRAKPKRIIWHQKQASKSTAR